MDAETKWQQAATRTETKRQHVAALFPLPPASKKLFEVLRLESGGQRSPDSRTSINTFVRIRINLGIGALQFERKWEGRGGVTTMMLATQSWHRVVWSALDGSKLPDAGIFKEDLQTKTCLSFLKSENMGKNLPVDRPIGRFFQAGSTGLPSLQSIFRALFQSLCVGLFSSADFVEVQFMVAWGEGDEKSDPDRSNDRGQVLRAR